jgi:uncharacterized protein (TIGR00251 family)
MASVRITVYVQPRASRTEVAGMHGDALKIRVTAPPVDNAANTALIDFIAAKLGIAKSSIRIAAGATGRRKVVEIAGVTLPEVTAALHWPPHAALSAVVN